MRINLSAANAQLIAQLRQVSGLQILQDGFDVVVIELADHTQLAVQLVERDIDVGLINDTLRYNAVRNQATIFMLWAPMLLPDDGMIYRPYDWMQALLALHDGKIYGFEMFNNRLFVFPVYFEPYSGIDYVVRWGQRVDFTLINVQAIETRSSGIQGQWQIGAFEPPAASSYADAANDNQPRRRAVPYERRAIIACFVLLELEPDAEWEVVKKAYHVLARQYHPDLNQSPDALAKMQAINAAYARISEVIGDKAP